MHKEYFLIEYLGKTSNYKLIDKTTSCYGLRDAKKQFKARNDFVNKLLYVTEQKGTLI